MSARGRRCLLALACGISLGGCVRIPEQARYVHLRELASSDEPFVRVYGARIPGLPTIAIHTWLVTKAAGRAVLHRWEVWQRARGAYEHVQRDLLPPAWGVGSGPGFVIASLNGPAAREIAETIERDAPSYPCRGLYVIFPGPNSNSFVKWMLHRADWDVELPASAIGEPCEP